MGVLFIAGLILILYIALGFVYLQQGTQQKEFQAQILKFGSIVARPLPSADELQAEYENVNLALAPLTDQVAIATIVSIAEKSGIDVSGNGLRVPSAFHTKVSVGSGGYSILSFGGINVQGDYDSVMAFISDLESGKTLENMVLKRVGINEIKVAATGEEGARRAEFRNITAAVKSLMDDNGLLRLPNPINFGGGVATNLMGDDPDTEAVIEGFPDIATPVTGKGYTGTGTPRGGYVLYMHDKILAGNTDQFESINYVAVRTTKYYYTCEADGTVRQFDEANVAVATEYLSSEEFRFEIRASLDVDIYTKPEG